MKLFAIKSPTGKIIPGLYFPDKSKAKSARDELNKTESGHVVTYGPEHRRYKSVQ